MFAHEPSMMVAASGFPFRGAAVNRLYIPENKHIKRFYMFVFRAGNAVSAGF
jgi:hypothetical protein